MWEEEGGAFEEFGVARGGEGGEVVRAWWMHVIVFF